MTWRGPKVGENRGELEIRKKEKKKYDLRQKKGFQTRKKRQFWW